MKSLLLALVPALALAAPSPAPAIDTGGLSDVQKDTYKILVEKFPSPCGRAHSLARALLPENKCGRAPFAARFIVMLLRLGLSQPEIEEHYSDRFITPKKGHCRPGAPVRGEPNAPVVICLFSDFQCPHCGKADPLLKRILDERRGKVQIWFKQYPIAALHPNARAAAAAAVAAGQQGRPSDTGSPSAQGSPGKFWEMHDKLFANQEKLDESDIEKYARELKLDIPKFKTDLAAAGPSIDRDRAEGDALGVSRTPSLFIAGRLYRGPLKYEHILDWVDEELAAR